MEIEALIARGLQVLLALGGAYLVATWFVLAIWTFRDIEARSRSIVTQVFSTLLVVMFWVPGLMLYWLLRPKETLDEAYQRSLEEEYLLQDLEEMPLCPTCNHFVEDDWQLCPHCNTQLREPCASCDHLIDLRWDVCPYCGTEQHRHTHDDGHRDEHLAEERWVDPAVIEKRLRDAEAKREREATRALPAMTAASVDDRHELMESLRRLEVIRPQPSSNGDGHHEHEQVGASVPRDSEVTEEAKILGPNLDDIAAGRDEEDSSTESDTIPERFKV